MIHTRRYDYRGMEMVNAIVLLPCCMDGISESAAVGGSGVHTRLHEPTALSP